MKVEDHRADGSAKNLPSVGKALPEGYVRRKMDALFRERIFGAEARGPIYDEAENAFRTHADDSRTPEQDAAMHYWTKGYGLWQGEYWGKTMLSVAGVARLFGDAELTEWARTRALAFVREFQRPDGYLCSYAREDFVGGPGSGPEEDCCWNVWGRKYTMWALLDLAALTGETALRDAAARLMDHLMAQLSRLSRSIRETGCYVGLPSMSILKPLLVLYQATGEGKYLDFADGMVALWDEPGNPAPNLLVNAFGKGDVHEWYPNLTGPKGGGGGWAKAYEMMSCLEGLVEYARLRQSLRILEAVERIVAKLERSEANAVGSVGFFDHFTHAAASPNALSEPCDVIHWIRLLRALFLSTGKPHYLDVLETAFYNAFLAGVYRDGRWGAHAVRSHGSRHWTAPEQVGMHRHQCCVDNMPRTFVDIAETVLTGFGPDGLSVNLYSDAHGALGDREVSIEGNFPFGDTVTVRIRATEPGSVRFRIPAYAESFSLDGEVRKGDWAEARLTEGDNVFVLGIRRSVRIVESDISADAPPRAPEFERKEFTPEMEGLARTDPAARLVYGPLLLAKSKRLGSPEAEILSAPTIRGRGFSCSLRPLAAEGVSGAWTAEFSNGTERFTVPVCDFASAADSDDPDNRFSLWF